MFKKDFRAAQEQYKYRVTSVILIFLIITLKEVKRNMKLILITQF